MRSKIFQRILDATPKDVEIFVDWYAEQVIKTNRKSMRETEINNRIFELDIERSKLVAEKKKLQFESVLPELREKYEDKFFASADSHETQGTFYHVLRVISKHKVEAMVLENYNHQVTLSLCKEIDMERLEYDWIRIAAFDFLMIMEEAKSKFNF